ncbi:MAG: ABC transporter ATP-binding protein [Chloroflexi bacterium]|nr:ABC transporter ATP-binding protein [Chloroflexota bacterium]
MAESGTAPPGREDLVVHDLVKEFAGGVLAVNHVSLTIQEGQFTTLLGPSGCGKTTTLNCIAGLEQPDGGRITVGGAVLTDVAKGVILPPERRNLGMVFQSYALWPHMTVFDNLAFGLKLHRVPGAEIRTRIGEALDLVGLANLEKRYPFQLSGGQQQRVALARAVVAQPRVLLLDEPLSNLDAKVREQARFWLREFQQRLGITTVYVTHDQGEALAISDMVAVMSQGHLLQFAPPKDVYERPATRFVADFIGQTSFLEGTIERASADTVDVRLARSGRVLTASAFAASTKPVVGKAATLAVRSEKIRVGATAESEANVLPARIKSFVYVGSAYEYIFETSEGDLRASSPVQVDGVETRLGLPPEALVLLADEPAGR